ncbi:MAG TPA: hypothetical protein VKZ63_19735, partial [Kofleriaceae bacterium]|nr:hypothetical protein [Kofleriaceae bacterium]
MREGSRVCHVSIQRNHIHLIVEATSAADLARGMQGLQVRLTRRLNRALGRSGTVFPGRYHGVQIRTPRQMRAVLYDVLQNARRHGEALPSRWGGVDPFSSAWSFDGWSSDAWRRAIAPAAGPPPVAPPESWLLCAGWRRHGPIRPDETPPAAGRSRPPP